MNEFHRSSVDSFLKVLSCFYHENNCRWQNQSVYDRSCQREICVIVWYAIWTVDDDKVLLAGENLNKSFKYFLTLRSYAGNRKDLEAERRILYGWIEGAYVSLKILM